MATSVRTNEENEDDMHVQPVIDTMLAVPSSLGPECDDTRHLTGEDGGCRRSCVEETREDFAIITNQAHDF
jgi:hypothetical protein